MKIQRMIFVYYLAIRWYTWNRFTESHISTNHSQNDHSNMTFPPRRHLEIFLLVEITTRFQLVCRLFSPFQFSTEMSLKFLSKKSWHTTNLDNVEKVWIAEQAAEKEKRKVSLFSHI